MNGMRIIIMAMALLCGAAACRVQGQLLNNSFLVLCYHDIPAHVNGDNYGVDRDAFVEQIEYLRAHGYKFVSMDDVVRAHRNEKPLPDKAVLLTFDDAYYSFYEFAMPVLKMYGYPCLLAVVTGWVDNPPAEAKNTPLMNWEQLREVVQSGLVELASHTHELHRTVLYNPQGNDCWAAVSRIYDPLARAYETEDAYRARIYEDFRASAAALQKNCGVSPRALVWPYGQYNYIAVDEAKRAGMELTFALEDKIASTQNVRDMPRYILVKNPSMGEIISALKNNLADPVQQRVLQADLDIIYDPDPAEQEKNLDAFIERVVSMKVSAVYLQAFCDDAGDGNVRSVYFPNRVLPMKADLFNRVTNQLAIRDIEVYAWMPVLSIVLPDSTLNERLKVRERVGDVVQLPTSWYCQRLSPFNSEAADALSMLYADMAANARIRGVIFQDDGYLNDREDFSPAAIEEYKKITGNCCVGYEDLSPGQKKRWTEVKTHALIALTDTLKEAVRAYRPAASFARTLYAPVLSRPQSEEWFAQNFADSLYAYDYVVVMAYPRMEEVKNPVQWLSGLVSEAGKYDGGLEKTVFKVQTYDWKRDKWIGSATIDRWMRTLVAAGARHIAYYPDDFTKNMPDERVVRLMMSVEDFPFSRAER